MAGFRNGKGLVVSAKSIHPLQKNAWLKSACLFFLFLGTSFSISYWAMAKYDVNMDFSAAGDAQSYIKMSKLEFDGVPRRFQYRILMPTLVFAVGKITERANLSGFLSQYYEDVNKKIDQLNFGIVNVLFLALTAMLLFHYCMALGFDEWESLIGAFFFLTSFFTINYYTIPMVDSLGAFFVMAGFLAVLKNSLVGLSFSFLFGVFTKETTFVLLLLIVLIERRIFSMRLLVCMPGILLFVLFTRVLPVASHDQSAYILSTIFSFSKIIRSVAEHLNTLSIYTLIEHSQTYMFLWALFFYALVKCRKPVFLKRSLWLMLLPVLVPPLVSSPAVGRVAFYLFPIVIPLSLLALRDLLGRHVPAI